MAAVDVVLKLKRCLLTAIIRFKLKQFITIKLYNLIHALQSFFNEITIQKISIIYIDSN